MKRVTALLIALCVPASARADLGPPEGLREVPVTTTVEATEAFSDYAFFEISYSSRPGPPPFGGSSRSVTLHFFAPGTSIKATGERRSGGTLYAVPRDAAARIPGWEGHAADAAKHNPPKHSTVSTSDEKWFELAQAVNQGEVPGASSVGFGTTQELPLTDPRDAIAVSYRIARTPTGVEFLRPGETESATGDSPDARRPFPWQWVAAGGAAFGALVLGGVWLARREARRA